MPEPRLRREVLRSRSDHLPDLQHCLCAPPASVVPTARTYLKPVKKVVPDIKPEAAPEDDDLPVIDRNEEPGSENDETLIEEVEEESPDVSAIIDAPVEPDEKI